MTVTRSDAVNAVRNRREDVQERRDALSLKLGRIVDGAVNEKRQLLASENRDFDRAKTELLGLDEELRSLDVEVAELERRASARGDAEEARRISGGTGLQSAYTSPRGGDVYAPGDASVSFFKDLRASKLGDVEAAQRLQQNNLEARAMGNTGAVGGSGGEFAPPAWLVADFVALARAGCWRTGAPSTSCRAACRP